MGIQHKDLVKKGLVGVVVHVCFYSLSSDSTARAYIYNFTIILLPSTKPAPSLWLLFSSSITTRILSEMNGGTIPEGSKAHTQLLVSAGAGPPVTLSASPAAPIRSHKA